jgi:hypothetical protein
MKITTPTRERGAGLIVMIIVIAFLMSVGILLLFVTGTGSAAAGNVRQQGRAFDAAEAGFDAVFEQLNANIILNQTLADFSLLYRTTFDGQPGLDDPAASPANPNYYMRRTDEELWQDVVKNPANAIFVNQPLATDGSLAYTVFLINDEAAPGITLNDRDCDVVCIGRAGRDTYARIVVKIEIQQ